MQMSMLARITLLPVALTVALAARPAAAAQACYSFSGPAAGTTYTVGDVLALPSAAATFKAFQWANLMWTAAGIATVVVSNFALGTVTKELNENNINLDFVFNSPSDQARFLYADLGGNVNFAVNGDFRNVSHLSALNGMVIGGALVTVVLAGGGGGGNERGSVQIVAPSGVVINSVMVGGQEFYLDDMCHHW